MAALTKRQYADQAVGRAEQFIHTALKHMLDDESSATTPDIENAFAVLRTVRVQLQMVRNVLKGQS